DEEHFVPFKGPLIVVLRGELEKRLQGVVDADLRRRREVVGSLGHEFGEETIGFLLGVLGVGRGALAEIVLPALLALAPLVDPPVVVLAEERFLRNGNPSGWGTHRTDLVNREVCLSQPPGLTLRGAATISCYKPAVSEMKLKAGRFDLTSC